MEKAIPPAMLKVPEAAMSIATGATAASSAAVGATAAAAAAAAGAGAGGGGSVTEMAAVARV